MASPPPLPLSPKHLLLPTPLSLLHPIPPPHSSTLLLFQNPSFHRPFPSSSPQKQHEQNPSERKDSSNPVTGTAEIIFKSSTGDEFKLELDSNDVVITQDLVERVLKHLAANPDAARRFFRYVSDTESSKASLDEIACALVCEVIRQKEWGDWVEERLRDLFVQYVSYSSELVSMILRELGASRNEVEAMRFFRWLQGSNLFEHDERTYNAMLRVLGNVRDWSWDGIEFWRLVDEMRGAGFGMSRELYDDLPRTAGAIEDCVDLYEFAMGGADCKPSIKHCSMLLREVVLCTGFPNSEVDMNLFRRVIKAFTQGGNALKDFELDKYEFLHCLIRRGRLGECSMILKALEEGGFVPSDALRSKIAFQLRSEGGKGRREFMKYYS